MNILLFLTKVTRFIIRSFYNCSPSRKICLNVGCWIGTLDENHWAQSIDRRRPILCDAERTRSVEFNVWRPSARGYRFNRDERQNSNQTEQLQWPSCNKLIKPLGWIDFTFSYFEYSNIWTKDTLLLTIARYVNRKLYRYIF